MQHNIKSILANLQEFESDLKSAIEYEKQKENHDMIRILTDELYKVKKAVIALEE